VPEAEVARDDARVGRQRGARTGQRYLSGIQDMALLGELQGRPRILLDQQDRDARFLDFGTAAPSSLASVVSSASPTGAVGGSSGAVSVGRSRFDHNC